MLVVSLALSPCDSTLQLSFSSVVEIDPDSERIFPCSEIGRGGNSPITAPSRSPRVAERTSAATFPPRSMRPRTVAEITEEAAFVLECSMSSVHRLTETPTEWRWNGGGGGGGGGGDGVAVVAPRTARHVDPSAR